LVVKDTCHKIFNLRSTSFSQDSITYYLFLSKYHLKLGHDVILYHLF
jgi:hypothetical protein